jgi:hypothetical protein
MSDMHFAVGSAIVCRGKVLMTAYSRVSIQKMIEFWNTRSDNLTNELVAALEFIYEYSKDKVATQRAGAALLMIEERTQ